MDVFSDKTVKIRKPHQCFACTRRFPVGTSMRSQTHNYDGMQTVYNCETCGKLMNEFKDYFFDDSEMLYPWGCVHELYHDFKVNSPEDLLNSLRQKANSKVGDTTYLQNRLFWAFDAGRNCVWQQYIQNKTELSELKQALKDCITELMFESTTGPKMWGRSGNTAVPEKLLKARKLVEGE